MAEWSILGSGHAAEPDLKIFQQFNVGKEQASGVDGLDEGVEEAGDGSLEGRSPLAFGYDGILGHILLEYWSAVA